MYYVFDDSCPLVQYLAPMEGVATPIMQRIVADSQPMVTEWLCRVCHPIHIGPCLSNWPDQLDPCNMVGCQGRVAHHYWAMMTNITEQAYTKLKNRCRWYSRLKKYFNCYCLYQTYDILHKPINIRFMLSGLHRIEMLCLTICSNQCLSCKINYMGKTSRMDRLSMCVP